MRPQYLSPLCRDWSSVALASLEGHLGAFLLHKTTYCLHVLESANKSLLHTWVEMSHSQYWNPIQHHDFSEFKPRSTVLNNPRKFNRKTFSITPERIEWIPKQKNTFLLFCISFALHLPWKKELYHSHTENLENERRASGKHMGLQF